MTDDRLTITAIVPVYNGAAYVAEAIRSVLAQDRPVSELILVDDGSTDDSAAVVAAAIEAHTGPERLVLIRQDNAGQSAARNTAVAQATGELLAFLDQDDRWHADHLRRLAAPLDDRPGLGVSYGDFDEIDAAGLVVVRSFIATYRIPHPRTSVVDFIGSDTMMLPTAAVVRATAYRDVGGFDPALIGYEDDDLWIRLFRAGWGFRFVPRSTAVFRIHGGSSSFRASFRESRVRFFTKVSSLLPDDPELRRYYTSQVLLPRLVGAAWHDYLAALRDHRYDEAVAVAHTIEQMVEQAPGQRLRAVERGLLRRPRLVHAALRRGGRVTRAAIGRLGPGARMRQPSV